MQRVVDRRDRVLSDRTRHPDMRSADPVGDRDSLHLRLRLLRIDVVREPVKRRGHQRGDDDDPALVRRPEVQDGLRLAAFPTARVERRRGN